MEFWVDLAQYFSMKKIMEFADFHGKVRKRILTNFPRFLKFLEQFLQDSPFRQENKKAAIELRKVQKFHQSLGIVDVRFEDIVSAEIDDLEVFWNFHLQSNYYN
jgi:hypothetical protein